MPNLFTTRFCTKRKEKPAMTHKTFEQYKAELAATVAEYNAQTAKDFTAASEAYQARMLAMQNWVPPVSPQQYATGRFIRVKTHHDKESYSEIPVQFIESIEVNTRRREYHNSKDVLIRAEEVPQTGRGGVPTVSYAQMPSDESIAGYLRSLESADRYMPSYLRMPRVYPGHVDYGEPAEIRITMASGQKILVTCWPEQLDLLLEALRREWKGV